VGAGNARGTEGEASYERGQGPKWAAAPWMEIALATAFSQSPLHCLGFTSNGLGTKL